MRHHSKKKYSSVPKRISGKPIHNRKGLYLRDRNESNNVDTDNGLKISTRDSLYKDIDNLSDILISKYNNAEQDLVLVEECNELIEALLKMQQSILRLRRGRVDRESIIEEMAHVSISSEVLRKIMDITHDELCREVQRKIDKYKLAPEADRY